MQLTALALLTLLPLVSTVLTSCTDRTIVVLWKPKALNGTILLLTLDGKQCTKDEPKELTIWRNETSWWKKEQCFPRVNKTAYSNETIVPSITSRLLRKVKRNETTSLPKCQSKKKTTTLPSARNKSKKVYRKEPIILTERQKKNELWEELFRLTIFYLSLAIFAIEFLKIIEEDMETDAKYNSTYSADDEMSSEMTTYGRSLHTIRECTEPSDSSDDESTAYISHSLFWLNNSTDESDLSDEEDEWTGSLRSGKIDSDDEEKYIWFQSLFGDSEALPEDEQLASDSEC